MTDYDLKPCPHCGEEAHIDTEYLDGRRGDDDARFHSIGCHTTGCEGASFEKYGFPPERLRVLVHRWNRRADQNRVAEKLAAEVNRRRGEMAVAREALDELRVPKERDGITLTFRQRIEILGAERDELESMLGG